MGRGTVKSLALGGMSMMAASLAAEPVRAQAGMAANGTPAGESAELGEVVVTARRKEERLQEVPVAVTAATGEQLEQRSVRTVSDLSSFTPNLRLSQESRGGTHSSVSLRGMFAVNLTIANDPAVGIYFDEVPIGRSAGAILSDLQDLESVQVLRGNQGTLFGRNNTGGAILLTPRRPDLHEIEGAAAVTLGNYGLDEQAAVLSAPIVDGKLGIRLAYKRVDRSRTGRRFNAAGVDQGDGYGIRDRQSGRVSLRFQPADNLVFDLTHDFARTNDAGLAVVRINPPQALPAGFEFGDAISLVHPESHFNAKGYTFHAAWGINPDTTLKVISGYRELAFHNAFDGDGAIGTSIDNNQEGRQHQFSAEANLSGVTLRDVVPGVSSVDYVMGLFYFSEEGLDESNLPPFPRDERKRLASRYTRSTGNNSSVAAYGQLEAHFTEATSAWLGLRYTSDRRDFAVRSFSNGACILEGAPAGCVLRGSQDFGYGSWSVGVRHAFSRDISVYARAARGQRAGGLDDTRTDIQTFSPEVLEDYEVGLKADWLDGRLRTNLAVFYGDFKNIQRSTLVEQPLCTPVGSGRCAPFTSVVNVGEGHIQGVELEATVRPVEGLTLNGSLGYLKAVYDTWTARPPSEVGNQFTGTPRWSYSLSATYDFAVGSFGEATARVDYGYKGETMLSAPRTVFNTQESVGLLNARFAFRPAMGGRWRPEIAIWGKNLTDEEFYTSVLVSGGATAAWQTDEPRTYGITLSVKY
jgi:iron complex outermembrane receptor protein